MKIKETISKHTVETKQAKIISRTDRLEFILLDVALNVI